MSPDGAVQHIEKMGQYLPTSGGVLRTALYIRCVLLLEDLAKLYSYAKYDYLLTLVVDCCFHI